MEGNQDIIWSHEHHNHGRIKAKFCHSSGKLIGGRLPLLMPLGKVPIVSPFLISRTSKNLKSGPSCNMLIWRRCIYTCYYMHETGEISYVVTLLLCRRKTHESTRQASQDRIQHIPLPGSLGQAKLPVGQVDLTKVYFIFYTSRLKKCRILKWGKWNFLDFSSPAGWMLLNKKST